MHCALWKLCCALHWHHHVKQSESVMVWSCLEWHSWRCGRSLSRRQDCVSRQYRVLLFMLYVVDDGCHGECGMRDRWKEEPCNCIEIYFWSPSDFLWLWFWCVTFSVVNAWFHCITNVAWAQNKERCNVSLHNTIVDIQAYSYGILCWWVDGLI